MTVYGAADWPSEVAMEADGGILMDADTGTILYGKNINEAYYPASITKLLTAQVVLDQCRLDEVVEFSQNAVYNVEQGSKSLSMDTGDRMSVKDCLYGLILHSANEVANALAEHAAGSTEEFAKLMNKKAKELGCTGSNFVNPSGLNDPDHYTTAYDMALIARSALNYPEIVEIMGTRVYKIPPSKKAPEGQTISPGHKMLKKNDSAYDPRVFGGKTGFTSLAGNTLVTYAKKDDMTLISVILNGHQTHYTDTKKLLDFGFSQFESKKLADYEGSLVPENHLTYSDRTDQSLLLLNQNSRIVLPKEADLSAVVPIVSYDETSLTPSGTVVTVNYLYGERTVGHAWITPNPAIESRLTRSAVPDRYIRWIRSRQSSGDEVVPPLVSGCRSRRCTGCHRRRHSVYPEETENKGSESGSCEKAPKRAVDAGIRLFGGRIRGAVCQTQGLFGEKAQKMIKRISIRKSCPL